MVEKELSPAFQKLNFEELQLLVGIWAEERELLKRENVTKQTLKTVSEVGELCDAVLKNDEPKIIDGIGDVLVTLIILSEQYEMDIVDCLRYAYAEIAKRKGKTVGGIFIKEQQESQPQVS